MANETYNLADKLDAIVDVLDTNLPAMLVTETLPAIVSFGLGYTALGIGGAAQFPAIRVVGNVSLGERSDEGILNLDTEFITIEVLIAVSFSGTQNQLRNAIKIAQQVDKCLSIYWCDWQIDNREVMWRAGMEFAADPNTNQWEGYIVRWMSKREGVSALPVP
jgi:hypothetical protein